MKPQEPETVPNDAAAPLWKKAKARARNMIRLAIPADKAWAWACSGKKA